MESTRAVLRVALVALAVLVVLRVDQAAPAVQKAAPVALADPAILKVDLDRITVPTLSSRCFSILGQV